MKSDDSLNGGQNSEAHVKPDSEKPQRSRSKSGLFKIGLMVAGILMLVGAVYWYGIGAKVGFPGAKKDGAGLFPFVSMGSWGYMDSSGKIVIEPQFDNIVALAPFFSEGLAPVEVGRKWGYIDQNGKMVIRPQFEKAWLFQDGLAAVGVKFPVDNGKSGSYTVKTGYIDKTGKVVISPQNSGYWNNGGFQTPVRIGETNATVDRWANYYFDPYISHGKDQPNNFSNGLLAVEINAQWGYMGKDGEMVIKPQFEEALTFSEGVAAVKLEDKWGYIDISGNQVIKQQYDKAGLFAEGLAAFGQGTELNNDYRFGFREDPDSAFSGGKWGYIHTNGKLLTTPQFDGAKSFSEGLAAVRVGAVWGYLDKTGKIVITPKYQKCLSFSGGLAPVCMKGKWGYADKNGNEVIKIQFDQAGEFVQGLAQVVRKDRRGYIDTDGVVVRWDER